MTKTVEYLYEEGFVFKDIETGKILLCISQENYILDANQLYSSFFKDIEETPVINFINSYEDKEDEKERNGKASYIFTEVTDIVDKICLGIKSKVKFPVENVEFGDS